MVDKNMVANSVEPEDNGPSGENNLESQETENATGEEYDALNALLDQLNSALDILETKNDGVYAELVDLLKSNQEVRRQIQESSAKNASEKESANFK